MPNARAHLPVAAVIDWPKVMLLFFFSVGSLLQMPFWSLNLLTELNLLLHLSDADGPWVINHVASQVWIIRGLKPKGKKGQWRGCDPNHPLSNVFSFWWSQQRWCLWFLRHLPVVTYATEGWSPSLPREHRSLLSIWRIFFFFLLALLVKYILLNVKVVMGLWARLQIVIDLHFQWNITGIMELRWLLCFKVLILSFAFLATPWQGDRAMPFCSLCSQLTLLTLVNLPVVLLLIVERTTAWKQIYIIFS